ncbi:hypothetical protein EVC26_062 [Rhizobium phage RHph_I72]|nr:hypothetical protein EVC13_060 [Rhizobium phage RHph_I65]QIG76508.1 hypothetical protein EVC26_062 [Rhizobium phage RHph_I72]
MWAFFMTTKLGRSIALAIGVLALAGVIVLSFRIWLARHDATILHGYVLEERALTAEAKLAEVERQAKANKIVADAYQVQYKNLLAQQQLDDQRAEADRAAYEAEKSKTDACQDRDGLDDNDLKFLLRPRSR